MFPHQVFVGHCLPSVGAFGITVPCVLPAQCVISCVHEHQGWTLGAKDSRPKCPMYVRPLSMSDTSPETPASKVFLSSHGSLLVRSMKPWMYVRVATSSRSAGNKMVCRKKLPLNLPPRKCFKLCVSNSKKQPSQSQDPNVPKSSWLFLCPVTPFQKKHLSSLKTYWIGKYF